MARIVIFDSGVGGLSIYALASQLLTDHQFVFVSDNECYPYGTKSESFLIERVLTLGRQIVDIFSPDIIVIACNTASTVVLPALRDALNVSIVGVVPAIKPAALLSKTKQIGILATPGTIARTYTSDLISEFASECQVKMLGSSTLVDLAEQKLRGNPIDLVKLKLELEPFLIDRMIDVVVLACTHFPLLNNEVESVFKANNRNIQLLDSAEGIANRLLDLCRELPSNGHLEHDEIEAGFAYFTKEIDGERFFLEQLGKLGLSYKGVL